MIIIILSLSIKGILKRKNIKLINKSSITLQTLHSRSWSGWRKMSHQTLNGYINSCCQETTSLWRSRDSAVQQKLDCRRVLCGIFKKIRFPSRFSTSLEFHLSWYQKLWRISQFKDTPLHHSCKSLIFLNQYQFAIGVAISPIMLTVWVF